MKRHSFTLMELLVAASLMALISAAIISVFAAGLKVYDRLRGWDDIRADISLSLGKMERDLRNACNIAEIEFRGEPDRITLPAPVGLKPGRVSYYVDADSGCLVREEEDYSAATAMERGQAVFTKLVPADSIKFSYYYYDSQQEQYLWNETWRSEPKDKAGRTASTLGAAEPSSKKKGMSVNTPLGVGVEIRRDAAADPVVVKRTILFPLAVSLHFAEMSQKKALAVKK